MAPRDTSPSITSGVANSKAIIWPPESFLLSLFFYHAFWSLSLLLSLKVHEENKKEKKMTQQQGKVLDGKGRKRHGMGEGPPACFTHWAWRGRGWKTTSTLLPHLIFSIMCKCVSRPCKRNNKNYKPYLNTSSKHGTKKKLQYMTYVKETIY